MTERPSTELARVLRSSPPALDELRRGRIERALVKRRTAPAPARPLRARRLPVALAGAAALAAAAAALVLLRPGAATRPDGTVHAVLRSADGTDVTRSLARGSTIATGPAESADLRTATSHVAVAAATEVTLRRSGPDVLVLRVARGRVRVAFDPPEGAGHRLAVETPEARVEVVGTAFSVQRDERYGTTVSVEEGVVRVVPRGSPPLRLTAGQTYSGAPEPPAATAQPRAPCPDGPCEARFPSAAGDGPTTAAAEGQPRSESAEDGSTPTGAEAGSTPTGEDRGGAARAVRQGSPTPPPPSAGEALAAAQEALAAGDRALARSHLERATRGGGSRGRRAEAASLLGDLAARDGDRAAAQRAYEQAAAIGQGLPQGHNALFDLARFHERGGDADAARRAYLRYLDEAAEGALADLARSRLCELGDPGACAAGP
ncbi:MAG: FecR domain-containing protein [Sandaracinaceae bacterium]